MLCLTAKEELAKVGIELPLAHLVELLRHGNYAVNVYTAITSINDLTPKSESTIESLGTTNLFPGTLGLTCSPSTIVAGQNSACMVTINFFPITNTVVSLISNDPGILTVPASVTVSANDSRSAFAATGVAQGTATITAGGAQTTTTAITTVTVKAPPSQCNTQQVSGRDTPETLTIEMGKSSGTFTFDYNNYEIPDRMVVFYEGRTLFDTGCVGGLGSVALTYSGVSTEITVQVIPNCSGTDSTGWDFTVNCPT
jgi:hypothetical protein